LIARGTLGVGSPSVTEALGELEHSSALDDIGALRIREADALRKQIVLNGIITRE
jgi:hypothetical protein